MCTQRAHNVHTCIVQCMYYTPARFAQDSSWRTTLDLVSDFLLPAQVTQRINLPYPPSPNLIGVPSRILPPYLPNPSLRDRQTEISRVQALDQSRPGLHPGRSRTRSAAYVSICRLRRPAFTGVRDGGTRQSMSHSHPNVRSVPPGHRGKGHHHHHRYNNLPHAQGSAMSS